MHLHESIASEDTVSDIKYPKGKCRVYDIPIQYYHCDNGRCANNVSKNLARKNGKTITYCGVNSRLQMVGWKKISETWGRQQELNSFMQSIDVQEQHQYICRHMPYGMPAMSTIACRVTTMVRARYNIYGQHHQYQTQIFSCIWVSYLCTVRRASRSKKYWEL